MRPIESVWTRREALRNLAIASGGLVVAACSDSTESTEAPQQGVAALATPPVELASDPFRLGVASGDPLSDSVILWTRLVIDPTSTDGTGGMPDLDVPVVWEVALTEGFTELLATGIANATPAFGHSIHVDVSQLDADRWYFYRFRAGSYTSPVGRTRTMPLADAHPDRLRLAFASCQAFDEGYYSAYRSMQNDDLDVVMFLGDYIYEYRRSSGRGFPDQPECTTLPTYRARYSMYKSDPDLQRAHARFPWIVTWDDHEVENNYAALSSEDRIPVEEMKTRRAAAYQAYYEHMPVRLDPPTGHDWRIYRSFNFGALAELFVLDGRQYRSDQACNSPLDALVSTSTCGPELAVEDRTMLGAEQENWLSSGLQASTRTWKVLAQQTVMSSIVVGDLILNVDQWDGYPSARDRLLGFIERSGIDNTVILTGDIHAAGAGVLKSGSKAVAVEFVTTSITSSGLTGLVPNADKIISLDSFPNLRYLNVLDHGYCRCEITEESWRTEYVVADISSSDQPARVDATLSVKAGTAELTKDA